MKTNKLVIPRFWLITGLTFILTFSFSLNSSAQFFSSKFSSRKRNKDIPTVIKADAMDFDLSKNVAVFSGNVQVDDIEMQIFCHKMIITFEGNLQKNAEKKITGKEKKNDKKEKMNKSVKDIICLKNVVIIRKLSGEDADGGEQKALAGKAVYDVQAGKITLTIKPELRRGDDLAKGQKIEFWLDSERLNIYGGTVIKIKSNPNN